MDKNQLIITIGTAVLDQWQYLLSSVFAIILTCIGLAWLLSNLLHKKEIRMLELQLSQQKETFSQFEAIVEQRVSVLQQEAEILKAKAIPQNNEEINSNNNGGINDAYAVAEPSGKYRVKSKLTEFIERTDLINKVIKGNYSA